MVLKVETAVEWASKFPKFTGGREGMKPGLERMEAMLSKLGSPQVALSFIHVAGTNGKGSTCAFLDAICQAAGLKVGLYTSPSLETFYDRMRINGRCVSDQQLDSYMGRLKPIVEEIAAAEAGEPTEFELVTALALLFFADEKPDIVIWETGLGGRLDATNVVTPLVSVITNIGLDHQHILGASELLIAKEKAGIIKTGVPVVTGATGGALEVILADAESKSAPVRVQGRDFTAEILSQTLAEQRMRYDSRRYHFGQLLMKMIGAHQVSNAALAICAAELVAGIRPDYGITSSAIRCGIEKARWPGRFEILCSDPLLILDGAHNPPGIQALVETVASLLLVAGIRRTIVIGILQDKALPEILLPLAALADRIVLTQPCTPRAAKTQELRRILECTQIPVYEIPVVSEAVSFAFETGDRLDAVLVTGSLFTISEARSWWKHRTVKGR